MSTGPTIRRGDPLLPPAIETRLWRYLTMRKCASLLETSELYFRRAALLPDAFEGTAPPTNVAVREALLERRPDLRPWIEPLPAFEAQARRETYVNCWFSGDAEDGAMWDQYAEGGRGVVIRTTAGRLGEAIVPNPARGVMLAQVTYIDRERERFVELGSTLRWYVHKDRRYANEREVRAITIHHQPEAQPDGLLVPVDLSGLLDQIVIGPRASGEVVLRVHELSEARGLRDRVRLSALELA